MAIERVARNLWVIECDTCDEGDEVEGEGFQAVLEWMEENGWMSYQQSTFSGPPDSYEWWHKCKQCVEDPIIDFTKV